MRLFPKYIVWATGQAAEPIRPYYPGQDTSAILIQHSSAFHGGEAYRDKRVLVVGTGNSGMDISQECHRRGAKVTILQRTGTAVVSQKFTTFALNGAFPPDTPIATSDARSSCGPLQMLLDMAERDLKGLQAMIDGDIISGLTAKGFLCASGPYHHRLYSRFGGFCEWQNPVHILM